MMKKAAIFDLDGTVSNTLEALAYCGNKALGDFSLSPIEKEHYKVLVGDGAYTLIERAVKEHGKDDKELIDKVYKRYREIFAVDCLYKAHPYEGIPELVEELRKRGLKTAVFSNKPHEEAIKTINGIGLSGKFDKILGVREGLKKKPCPDGALMIAEEFGVSPEECIYLGDTNTDMKTGKSAGMFTIGVLWGFRERAELEENHADAIISHPSEALSYID